MKIKAPVISLLIFILVCVEGMAAPIREEYRKNTIYYSDYGAVGDGVTDDFQAIIDAHAAANRTGAKVFADPGAVYYIGGVAKTAVISTDTDWSGAEFIIDDSVVEKNPNNQNAWLDSWVFQIKSAFLSSQITSVKKIQQNQTKLDASLPYDSVLVAVDNTTKRYIRRGANQNSGTNQTDVFIVSKNGNIDMSAPVMWDFENISSLTAYPIDEKTLTVKGGKFTTIANNGSPDTSYMKRGILVSRSNTVLDDLYHVITEEGDNGAPYTGFITFENCANVTIQNTTLSGHRVYKRSGDNVSMGTYDIYAVRTINLMVQDCGQTNDISNSYWWGIFASNYAKNIFFNNVKFSRFDAHQGVYNVIISNSELGWQGVSIIGKRRMTIANTKVSGINFINLRDDYGSTWEGDVIVRNSTFAPPANQLNNAEVIHARNDGQWDFGYPCYMPQTITFDGFTVEDVNAPESYQGILLLGNFNSSHNGFEPYPYTTTREVHISNFSSNMDYRITNNYLLNNLKIYQ